MGRVRGLKRFLTVPGGTGGAVQSTEDRYAAGGPGVWLVSHPDIG